jgi:hypothetical protein
MDKMRPHRLLVMITLLSSGCMTDPEEMRISETLDIRTGTAGLVINEIHFDPLQDENDGIPDQPDFVEIYNPGMAAVDLTGWSITDRPSQTGKVNRYAFAPSGSDNMLGPGKYAVIAPEYSAGIPDSRLVQFYRYLASPADAKIFLVPRYKTFSLNNDGDCVRLLDRTGAVVDSAGYTPDWHNPFVKSTKGISLEKYHPLMESDVSRSWTSSADTEYGATPGKTNAVYVNPERTDDMLLFSDNPYSPGSGGTASLLLIRINLPAGSWQLTLAVYDLQGRKVRSLANGSPAGPVTLLAWDGLDDERDPAPSGNYRISLRTACSSGSHLEVEKTLAVVR